MPSIWPSSFTATTLFVNSCIFIQIAHFVAAGWSEQDEAKRIAQIKLDERRQFEIQTGQKLPIFYETSNSAEEGADYNAMASQNVIQKRVRPSATSATPSSIAHSHHQQQQNLSLGGGVKQHWCFHCASPWNVLAEPMQRVVRNLMEVRRAQYPSAEAITRDCVEPRDLDRLPRQFCQGYSHCQTLVLTDHNAGTAFTVRGCAEHFGAVDLGVLGRRKDNTCRRLHDKVDIQECICEQRRYCYAGSERAWTNRYTEMETWHGPVVPHAAALRNGASSIHSNISRTSKNITSLLLSFILLLMSTSISISFTFQHLLRRIIMF